MFIAPIIAAMFHNETGSNNGIGLTASAKEIVANMLSASPILFYNYFPINIQLDKLFECFRYYYL